MIGKLVLVMVLTVGGACGNEAASPPVATPSTRPVPAPQPPEPLLRRVDLVGATIAPVKADGRQWDGLGAQANKLILNGLSAALASATPYAAAMRFLSEPATQALAKPDVTGVAELYIDGQLVKRHTLAKIQDSFTPQWTDVAWENVTPKRARLRIVLYDADLTAADPIGIMDLNGDDLLAAQWDGNVRQVLVSKQTNRQALFVAVSVM